MSLADCQYIRRIFMYTVHYLNEIKQSTKRIKLLCLGAHYAEGITVFGLSVSSFCHSVYMFVSLIL